MPLISFDEIYLRNSNSISAAIWNWQVEQSRAAGKARTFPMAALICIAWPTDRFGLYQFKEIYLLRRNRKDSAEQLAALPAVAGRAAWRPYEFIIYLIFMEGNILLKGEA